VNTRPREMLGIVTHGYQRYPLKNQVLKSVC
jgi:hypothetical protein